MLKGSHHSHILSFYGHKIFWKGFEGKFVYFVRFVSPKEISKMDQKVIESYINEVLSSD